MIGDIRKSLKTRTIKLVIWLMLGSLCLGLIPFALRMSGRNKADSIGVVNGQHIGALEFKRKIAEIQTIISEIRQNYGSQADMVLKMWGLDRRPEELVVDGLIGEKIIKAVSEDLGTAVHKEYVQAKLRDPQFVRQYLATLIPPHALRGGTLDVVALKQNLQRQSISDDEFEEILEETFLRAFLLKLIEGGLYIPEAELRNGFIGQYLKKKYAYVAVPRSKYEARVREQKITDKELESYYANPTHKESYRIPEKRSAKVWTFSSDNFGIVISDKELEESYLRRRSQYIKKPAEVDVQHILFTFTPETKIDARKKMQEIYTQIIAAPETFSAVAARESMSRDKGSTVSLKRGERDATFSKIAFDLEKGSISPVLETGEGFEIVKLVEKRAPVFKALDEVRADFTKKLKAEKFNGVFSSNAQRVVSQSRETPALLTAFVEKHKGQESSITDSVVAENSQQRTLFNLRKVGDKAFYQEGGKGYLIELTALTPSTIPVLSSIKDKVEKSIYESRALELLKKDLEEAKEALRSGNKNLEQVAQSLKGTVEKTDWISFSDQASMKKIQQMQIKLASLANLTRIGALMSEITDKDGYIFQLKEMDPFSETEYAKQKGFIRYQLNSQEMQGLVGAFLQDLREKAAIDLNSDLTKRSFRA